MSPGAFISPVKFGSINAPTMIRALMTGTFSTRAVDTANSRGMK